MKVIICGAGKVGTTIAKQLVLEDNDVTIVDQSAKLIDEINNSLDVNSFVGFASHPTTLEKAGAYDADMIVAVTQSDEINMIACQIAHTIFNVKKKIARIRSQNYFEMDNNILFSPDNIPIDVIISPEVEVAKAVLDRLHVPGANDTILFADGKVRVISVKCLENSAIHMKSLNEGNKMMLSSNINARLVGYIRDQEFLMDNNSKITEEDEIYFIVDSNHIREAMALFGHEENEARKIRIIGGGRIGLYMAEKLEESDDNNIKIVEYNSERANFIAEKLFNTTVVNGDALDQEILKEVNVMMSDTVIAVSNDDEVNILSSLLSKKFGCKKAIALINSSSFAPLFSSLGIDVIVNPREITVSSILRYIRSLKVRNVHSICESQIEIIETDAFESSYPVGKAIKDLDLPQGVVLSIIVRKGETVVPNSKTIIEVNDRLVIFSVVDKVKKVEKIFSDRFKYF